MIAQIVQKLFGPIMQHLGPNSSAQAGADRADQFAEFVLASNELGERGDAGDTGDASVLPLAILAEKVLAFDVAQAITAAPMPVYQNSLAELRLTANATAVNTANATVSAPALGHGQSQDAAVFKTQTEREVALKPRSELPAAQLAAITIVHPAAAVTQDLSEAIIGKAWPTFANQTVIAQASQAVTVGVAALSAGGDEIDAAVAVPFESAHKLVAHLAAAVLPAAQVAAPEVTEVQVAAPEIPAAQEAAPEIPAAHFGAGAAHNAARQTTSAPTRQPTTQNGGFLGPISNPAGVEHGAKGELAVAKSTPQDRALITALGPAFAAATSGQPAAFQTLQMRAEITAAIDTGQRAGNNQTTGQIILKQPPAVAEARSSIVAMAFAQKTNDHIGKMADGQTDQAALVQGPSARGTPPSQASAAAAAIPAAAVQSAAYISAPLGVAEDRRIADPAQSEGIYPILAGGEARSSFTAYATNQAVPAAGFSSSAAAISAQLLPLANIAQSGPVELVLSPAELGQLRFEIHQRGDLVQIVLSAERPETLDLLRRHSDQLQADFRASGFAGTSLSFGDWRSGQRASSAPNSALGGEEMAQAEAQSPLAQPTAFVRPPTYLDPSRSLNLRL